MSAVSPAKMMDVLHALYLDSVELGPRWASLDMLRDLYQKNRAHPKVCKAQAAMRLALSEWGDEQVADFLLNYLFQPPLSTEMRSRSPEELREVLSTVYQHLFLEFDDENSSTELSPKQDEKAMDEETVMGLLGYIESHYADAEAIQSKWGQYARAVEWAKLLKRWDLIIKLLDTLSYHLTHSHIPDQGVETSLSRSETMKSFWQQGRALVMEGLLAARQAGDQVSEAKFLGELARLESYLGGFETAVDCLKRKELLVKSALEKWNVSRELLLLGNRANARENFLAARMCYQASLCMLQARNNKRGMADVLDFLAANETARLEKGTETEEQFSDDLPTVVNSLWKLGDTLRRAADPNQAEEVEEVSSIYELLQQTLEKLNSPE